MLSARCPFAPHSTCSPGVLASPAPSQPPPPPTFPVPSPFPKGPVPDPPRDAPSSVLRPCAQPSFSALAARGNHRYLSRGRPPAPQASRGLAGSHACPGQASRGSCHRAGLRTQAWRVGSLTGGAGRRGPVLLSTVFQRGPRSPGGSDAAPARLERPLGAVWPAARAAPCQ